ncbi:MAG: DUF6531 domain-containing protein, partial [Burkholderiaceae bacterium]|nr:DUF6531 domain-containing protein [Burkholderiaceae bacterium]
MSGKPAARQGDATEYGGPIAAGSPNILVNGLPAARINDPVIYGGMIVQGSLTVLFNGRPASRQGDATLYAGIITTGSPNVFIGTQGGVACSVCPGGVAVGNPVNPQSGAKVLPGEEDMDFSLPGALPLIWQRQYNSYVNPMHGAACGVLGHGWHLLDEVELRLREDTLMILDAAGRVIAFEETLDPREDQYSRSEGIWVLRGGQQDNGYLPKWAYGERFAHVLPELAGDEDRILAASGSADVFWVFAPAPDIPPAKVAAQAADKAKLANKAKAKAKATGDKTDAEQARAADQAAKQAQHGQRWRLTAQIDRFGRSQRYEYSDGKTAQPTAPGQNRARKEATPPAGMLIAITDGVGRRYRLQYQRIHAGHEAQFPWGADDGWRLAAVQLEHDPLQLRPEPITLVRYRYNPQGQLITVHDRAGALVREFEWSRNRISAHRYRGGPWHRYRYEGVEPNVKVVAHTNEQGLDYTFEYQSHDPTPEGKPRHSTVVTDSLGRVETYRFEGDKGLSRLVEHIRADGSVVRNQYDGFGRMCGSTDALGRQSWIRLDGDGNVISTTQPGDAQHPAGLFTHNRYDPSGRIIESTDPAGAITRYQYDTYKRLTQIIQPDGSSERYSYPDPKEHPLICDNPIQIEDARGGVKRMAYNNMGQMTRYTDCSGQSSGWDHDRWGQVITVTDAQGNRTRHERDNAGRITATHLPNGQKRCYQYDGRGNLARIEPDANTPEAALEITRDLWSRPTRIEQGGLSVQSEYDKAGRLITLTNENDSKSSFVWDVMDQLEQETGFDGRVQRYRRDEAGQLIASTDGTGQEGDPVTGYRHDPLGRLTERLLPATESSAAQS